MVLFPSRGFFCFLNFKRDLEYHQAQQIDHTRHSFVMPGTRHGQNREIGKNNSIFTYNDNVSS